MHWLTQKLGCIPTGAALGYRVTHACLGEVKIPTLRNSPQITQEFLKAVGARLSQGKILFFRNVKSRSIVDYNECVI